MGPLGRNLGVDVRIILKRILQDVDRIDVNQNSFINGHEWTRK